MTNNNIDITYNSISKEEEIIFNKPMMPLCYLLKTRKDKKIHNIIPKHKRLFITKIYGTKSSNVNIEDPITPPKVNLCYLQKDKKIILIESKKDKMLKSVRNNFCYYTKLTGIKAEDIKNKYNEKLEDMISKISVEENEDEKKDDKGNKNNNKKQAKKKNKNKKKKNIGEDSYISASSDNKNIASNNKFKRDFMNTSNDNLKNRNKKYKSKARTVNSVGKDGKLKRSIPVLKFEKLKKSKRKNNTKNNEVPSFKHKNKKNKNNNNETNSSINNFSENDYENNEDNKNAKRQKSSSNKYKNKKRKNNNAPNENENDEFNSSNHSTKVHVHQFEDSKSNIKIRIRAPLSPNIKYEQIEIKAGGNKEYRIRKNIDYIEAKDKDKGKERNNDDKKGIKIKTNLKPLKFNYSRKNSRNSMDTKSQNRNQVKNPFYNKSPYVSNSKNSDSRVLLQNQNNPIIDNINSNNNRIINHYHGAGYERHYGIVENCPVCRSMQKKSEYMEEIIFGESRKKLNLKPTIKKEDFNPNSDQNEFKMKLKKKFIDFYKKEEEKNINNNLIRDLNPNATLYNKSKSKSNLFKDLHRKYSFRRNQSVKNINKNESDQSEGNSRINIFDAQFPAINSYFHS